MQPHAGGFTDINSNIVKSGLACACVTRRGFLLCLLKGWKHSWKKWNKKLSLFVCVCVHYLHGLNTLSVFLSRVRLCSRLFLSGFFGPSCSQIEGTIQARWITNSGQFVKSQFDPWEVSRHFNVSAGKQHPDQLEYFYPLGKAPLGGHCLKLRWSHQAGFISTSVFLSTSHIKFLHFNTDATSLSRIF